MVLGLLSRYAILPHPKELEAFLIYMVLSHFIPQDGRHYDSEGGHCCRSNALAEPQEATFQFLPECQHDPHLYILYVGLDPLRHGSWNLLAEV